MPFPAPFPKCLSLLIVGLVTALQGGCGSPSFLVTPVADTNRLEERKVQSGSWGGGKIAIVEIDGMLMNARTGGFLAPTENPVSLFAQQLETARQDSAVKAIVLRVNSPGGTVTASDTMYELVRRFREETGKPVVASAQEVAASGGYYVACAADAIYVQPTSVIGSVGVIFESVAFKGTLDKLGVTATSIKSGYLKDLGSPWKLLQDDERQIMQQLVDEYFTRFVSVVRRHRSISETAASDLNEYKKPGYTGVYSGRVFSGAQAVELGLADKTGLLEDAIDHARKLANAPKASVVMYSRPYGYGGSIYASAPPTPAQPGVVHLALPEQAGMLPTGFYYLWRP